MKEKQGCLENSEVEKMERSDIPCALLHRHDTFSSYDGMGLPKDAAKYAKNLGMNALGITNHGNMNSVAEHYYACKAEGIVPVIGVEAYHQAKLDLTKEGQKNRYHLTLIAKNIEGYYNLSQMMSDAELYSKYGNFPICDFDLLEKYREGVICLSGCVLGCLNRHIINDQFDEAKIHAEHFLDIYKDNFWFEVQPQEFEDQRKANLGILELAKLFNRPVVMTSDSHFIKPQDIDSYVILRQLNRHVPKPPTPEQIARKEEREKKKQERLVKEREKLAKKGFIADHETQEENQNQQDANIVNQSTDSDDMFKTEIDINNWADSIRKQYEKLYMQTGNELASRWQAFMGFDGSEYVRESQRIADVCSVELNFHEMVPRAIVEVDPTTQQPIPSKNVIARGIKRGLVEMGVWEKTAARQIKKEDGKTAIECYYPYQERAKFELKRILKKNMEDYFLLVADLVNEARRRDIAVGPGRGSAGASLVARALGITEFDPLKHDCMFDRFLPESRANLPDIDTDFGNRRDELKSYLLQKYNGQCAEIANFNRLTKDVLINDLARFLAIPEEIAELMKSIILGLGVGGRDKEIYPEYEKLMQHRQLAQFEQQYDKVITHFCTLYGSVRNLSKHASGVAISSGNLSKYTPLFVRAGETYTAYDKKKLEDLGIVKLDVLKVDALYALQLMCKMTGIDRLTIPENDKETFDAFKRLDVTGIFQFESPGAQKILQDIQADSIIDLAVATGLNRPGGMELKSLEVYLDGKNGNIDMSTLVAKCCKDTYGAFIFQEHALIACKTIGHMSDLGSISMMKKLHGQIHRDHPLVLEFIAGAKEHEGMSEEESWAFIQKITSYTFNKAHAIAYVLISYWQMYFKVHYPFEFYLASLQAENDANKRKRLEADAASRKDEKGDPKPVVVLLPHVNGLRNYREITSRGKRYIQAGLLNIDKVGGVAAKAIEESYQKDGPFQSEDDLLRRVNGTRKIMKGRGDQKQEFEEYNKSPIKTDTLEALKNAGALEFDMREYVKRSGEYLGSIKYAKRRRWA